MNPSTTLPPPEAAPPATATPRTVKPPLSSQAIARRCELLLFIATFFAFAYFNQGGGWNQNARFAEVRAMVEEGRFAIDNFLVYQRAHPDSPDPELVRCHTREAEYLWGGQRHRLCWVNGYYEYKDTPVGSQPLNGALPEPMIERCCSGDVGYVPTTGNFHPNKPPGTSFAAVPGYFLIYQVEKWLHVDPDNWWTLNTNAWLASVFSVGLMSAIGCVLFFRLGRDLAGGAIFPAVCATLCLAFGTTFFPFATLLFDHALTASLLIAAFYFLRRARLGLSRGGAFWAGLCAGLAVLTNYVALGAVVILGLYALARTERGWSWRRALGFVLGGIGPAALLLWYGYVCYGHPFSPSNDFQNPLFKEPDALLGMFKVPHDSEELNQIRWVAEVLLYSPFRGVFWFCPVLVFGLVGLFLWLRGRHLSAEARVCGGIFLFFFVVNVFFNGYHAGHTAGPRYLVPGLPFLALPLVAVFAYGPGRWFGAILGTLAIAMNLLLTATDAQNPVGVSRHGRVDNRNDNFTYDLVGEYAAPIFFQGNARPLLKQQLEVELKKIEPVSLDEEAAHQAHLLQPQVVAARRGDAGAASLDDLRIDPLCAHVERVVDLETLPATVAPLPEDLFRHPREVARLLYQSQIDAGDKDRFPLSTLKGPVSVNPVGVFEGLFIYGYFPPASPQAEWASFNVGELLLPRSRWSLLPLLLLSGGLSAWALFLAGREKTLSP